MHGVIGSGRQQRIAAFLVGAMLISQLVMPPAGRAASPTASNVSRGLPRARMTSRAVPRRTTLAAQTGTSLIHEGFSVDATTANGWVTSGGACLTAGDATTPTSSIPACKVSAPADAIGQGALQLTRNSISQAAMAVSRTPLSTANGLQVTFDDYAFNGTTPGGEGVAFFFTDASQPLPTSVAQAGGALGYASSGSHAGLRGAYVGVALDESGGFSSGSGGLNGGPATVPETIAVRGAAATNYQYIGGSSSAAGKAASLPFAFDQPAVTLRPAGVPTVRAQLTAAGELIVAVDIHNGSGFIVYYSQNIVGVGGQPAVPANVYFGVSASTGVHAEVHQISGLVVSALSSSAAQTTTLINETFANTGSTPTLWSSFGDACLTAGSVATPKTSVPACGANAPQDVAGAGALELTRAGASQIGGVIEKTPLPTTNGLTVTFTDYAFNGTTPGAEGVSFFLADASQPLPTQLGQRGSALGYAGTSTAAGLRGGYLGVGLDEAGAFSSYDGGPGTVLETIAVRGSAASGYQYLGGATNSAGKAASLPFPLDVPTATTRPASAPTVQATLTAAGLLTVAIDHHDGNGFVTYYSTTIVGVGGQPTVPANVYFGLAATTEGVHDELHQIGGLTIATGGTPPIATAPDNNPPQLVSANGSLTFNVSTRSDPVTGNPEFVYNGSTIPPTLRLLPGDTLAVNLTNTLPVPPAGAGYTDNINLHYHGLHVSPQAPSDDEIDMLAAPGQTLHYSITIPANHPTGLYWYHTHAHAETERDTLAGMSGALIVDGIAATTPQVANLTERVLVVRDAPLPGGILPNANLAQIYAMRWAMQHGVTMRGTHTSAAHVRTEFTASSTKQSRNPYVTVDANYRRVHPAASTDTHCIAGSPEQPIHALTVNGLTAPSLRIAPGEQQFWRVVNAGADTYVDLTVDKTTLQIVALDGVPISAGVGTPAQLTASDWVLPPGSRAEFLITGPPAGTTAYVRTNCFDAGPSGSAMPATILATINPAAASSTATKNRAVARIAAHAQPFRFHTASTLRPSTASRASAARILRNIRSATVAATQTIFYGDEDTINGIGYDPAAPPQFYAQSGTVQQWTIINTSAQVHTFHIHQVHFVVQSINGTVQAQQYVRDNVNVPASTTSGPGTVTLLLDFTDPTVIGTFLLHCHILAHEDGGMMAKIRVGTAPPLTLSTSTVSFAGPTSGAQSVTLGGGTAPYSVTGCSGVASAAVNGGAVSIVPAAPGACVLTVADASTPSITASIVVEIAAPAGIVSLSSGSVAFVSPTAAAQALTIAGGTAPYSVTGCTGIVTSAIAASQLTVAPQAPGTCTLTISDAKANTATLAVSVNATLTGNALDNLTFHQNALRTGWYQNETALTVANVASGSFGRIATLAAPAGMPALSKVYAQPLYVTNELSVDGKNHNLIIIAGSSGQIYAFDETTQSVVWHRDFTNAAAGILGQVADGCNNINPDQAIIGTPVIDRTLDRLFVVVATAENGTYYTRIHAIGLGTGVDVVTPTVLSGTVALATGGTASVSSFNNMNRAALLEANGNIYVGLGSHCDENAAVTHGWLLAYNATTLAQTANIVDSTNGNDGTGYYLGAIWMSGFGPAADANGNVYVATGNGSFNGTSSFAMSVLEVPGNLDMTHASFFTPIQEAADSAVNDEIGSGGVMLLPNQAGAYPHIAVAGGKCSTDYYCYKYMLNRDKMGGQQAGNAGTLWTGPAAGGIWGGPAYFADATGTGHIVWGGTPTFDDYTITTSPVGLTLATSSNTGCLECTDAGSQPIISSNGVTAGTAIAWALQTPGPNGGTIYLEAFDALNMGTPLYSGAAGAWTVAPGQSVIGGALVSPLVVNGRVYVPTDGSVAVFGLAGTPSRTKGTK